jgi:hypothetical protein
MKEKRNTYRTLVGKKERKKERKKESERKKERVHWKDLDVGGRIILKFNLEK